MENEDFNADEYGNKDIWDDLGHWDNREPVVDDLDDYYPNSWEMWHDDDDDDDYMDYSWEDYDKADEWPKLDNSLLARIKRILRTVKLWYMEKTGQFDDIPF